VWIEGTDFYLNGHKIRFKGDAWHYMGAVMQNRNYARLWYKFAKDSGCNIIRLHAQPYPEFYLDIADEIGIFIIDESPVYGSMGTIPVEEPEFWKNAKVAIEEFVRRDRNHPSVIIWSACNEVTWVPNGKKAIEPLLELGEIIKSLDPTRPVGYDGDFDLDGKAELLVGHYGGGWPMWSNRWKKDKPLMMDEFTQFFFGGPREACNWIGDAAYESFDKRLEGVGLEAEKFIRDFRFHNVAGITPWNLVWYSLEPLPFGDGKGLDVLEPPAGVDEMPLKRVGGYSATLNPGYDKSLPEWLPNPAYKYIKEAFKPLYVDVRELDNNFYGGTYLARTLVVYNDTSSTRKLKTVWRALLDGDLLEEGKYIADYAPYEKKVINLSIKLPAVEKLTTCHLYVTLYEEDEQLYSTEKVFKVHPKPLLQVRRGVFVFDPKGSLSIEGASTSAEELAKFLRKGKTLIIAPHLDEVSQIALIKNAKELENFVKTGGVILALAQDSINWSPFPLVLKPVATQRGFIRAHGHPLLDGIEDKDLKYWGGDGPIATKAFERKEHFGRALIDGGEGSQDILMLEIPYGRGAYIFCQLEDKCPPVYERILVNALAGRLPEYKRGEVLVLADEDSALVALLEQLQALYTLNDPGRGKWDLIIADAGDKGVFELLMDKFDWLIRRANNIIELARILPPGLEMIKIKGKMVNLVKTAESPIMWGLSNADLFVPDGIINEGFIIKDRSIWQGIFVRPRSDWGGWIGKYSAEQVKVAAIRRSEKELAKQPLYYGLVVSNINDAPVYLCSIKLSPAISKASFLRPLLENLGLQFGPPAPPPTKSIDVGDSKQDVRYIRGTWSEPQIASLYPQDFPIFGQEHSFRSISGDAGEIVINMPGGFDYKVALVLSANGGYTAMLNNVVECIPIKQEKLGEEVFAYLEGILKGLTDDEVRLSIKVIPEEGATVKLYGMIVTPDTPCRVIVDEEGFIRSWFVAGPLRDEGELLDKTFVADEGSLEATMGKKIGGRVWREYISPSWDINLQANALFGEEEQCAAYALTYIYVPEDKAEQYKDLQLLIGSDDGVKVWLNGELIWRNETARPVIADKDCIKRVSLKPGVNKLLLKVVNYTGGWGFCVRFATSAGVPVKNFW